MTDDELQAKLAAIQPEWQEPSEDKVSELVSFVKVLTDEEFVELLHKVSEMQVSRGLQTKEVAMRPTRPEEIIAIVEAIKKPGDRP